MPGKITHVWGYKLLIVLIWLCVPASAWLLVRHDHLVFDEQSKAQRRDCDARADLLRRYTVALAQQGRLIDYIADPESRTQWQQRWRAQTDSLDREQQRLRQSVPTHYPATDYALGEMDRMLAEQRDLLEEAAMRRDMYNKSSAGILQLAQQLSDAQRTADYYRSIGAQGIYLLIMEDLAVVEEQFHRRETELNRMAGEVNNALGTAALRRDEILAKLDELPQILAEDEKLTYRENLLQRIRQFSLRVQLQRLLASQPVT
jgi:hypothetical protein